MFPRTSNSSSIIICLLDHNTSTLEARSRILSSEDWQVEPFAHPDPFLDYARLHRPAAAVVDFGGSQATGLDVAERLRKISPLTSVIILLKVHRGEAQGMLLGNELINLVKEQCNGIPRNFQYLSTVNQKGAQF